MRNTICRHRARKRLPTPNRQKTPPDLCMKRLRRYRQRYSIRSRTVRRYRPRPQDVEICRVRHSPEDTGHRFFIHLIEIGAASNLRTPFCTQNKMGIIYLSFPMIIISHCSMSRGRRVTRLMTALIQKTVALSKLLFFIFIASQRRDTLQN